MNPSYGEHEVRRTSFVSSSLTSSPFVHNTTTPASMDKSLVSAFTNAKPTKLPDGFKPRDIDILCGRGRGTWDHAGNRRFKMFLEDHSKRYVVAKNRVDKGVVIASLVDTIREHGILFVKKDSKTQCWYDIGEYQAREKAAHAIRDHISKKWEKKSRKNKSRQQGNDQITKQQPTVVGKSVSHMQHHNQQPTALGKFVAQMQQQQRQQQQQQQQQQLLQYSVSSLSLNDPMRLTKECTPNGAPKFIQSNAPRWNEDEPSDASDTPQCLQEGVNIMHPVMAHQSLNQTKTVKENLPVYQQQYQQKESQKYPSLSLLFNNPKLLTGLSDPNSNNTNTTPGPIASETIVKQPDIFRDFPLVDLSINQEGENYEKEEIASETAGGTVNWTTTFTVPYKRVLDNETPSALHCEEVPALGTLIQPKHEANRETVVSNVLHQDCITNHPSATTDVATIGTHPIKSTMSEEETLRWSELFPVASLEHVRKRNSL